jgi:hypothetical protein
LLLVAVEVAVALLRAVLVAVEVVLVVIYTQHQLRLIFQTTQLLLAQVEM